MKKIDIFQSFQLLANFGVVVGLLLLVLELDQNSELLAMQARSTFVETKLAQQIPLLTNDGGIMDLLVAANQGQELTDAERSRWFIMMNMNVETWAALYREVTNGLIDESDIPIRYWRSTFISPSSHDWWEGAKADFDPEFVAFMEERVIGESLNSRNE